MTEHNEPAVGSTWRHKNGNQYIVEAVSNRDSELQDEYPTTVVYRGTNGLLWSRPLTRWHASMTLMHSEGVSQQAPAGADDRCFHRNAVIQHTGDGTPVEFCPECGTNRLVANGSRQQAPAKALTDDTRKLIERLRRHLTMSMFASHADLYAELNAQRDAAANAIESILAAHPAARSLTEADIENIRNAANFAYSYGSRDVAISLLKICDAQEAFAAAPSPDSEKL